MATSTATSSAGDQLLDVVQVESVVGLEGRVVPGFDLPQAGDARPHEVTVVELGRELVDLRPQRRPGPDQAHVAEEHVEQLRQLVEAGAAQDVPTRVMRGSRPP